MSTPIRARDRWPAIALFVAATFLCFPQRLGPLVFDFGPLFVWIAPALFVRVVRGTSPRTAALAGFLATWFAHGAVLYWTMVAVVVYGHAPAIVGPVAALGLAIYPGLFGALLGVGVARLAPAVAGGPAPGRVPWIFAVAALWVVFDHLRSFALTGFPWATLGYAHHENPWMLGLSSWTAVYGLSFASVLGSLAAVELGSELRRRRSGNGDAQRWTHALAGAAVVAAMVVVGAFSAGEGEPDPEGPVRVAALQGNIDQGQKWDRSSLDRTLEIYAELTRAAAYRGARVIAWPETAFPGFLELDLERRLRVQQLARETRSVLLVGAPGALYDPATRELGAVYDSAVAIGADGELLWRYDKTHLVPFGEYIPLRALIGNFVTALATGATSSDVTPGERVRAFDIELPERDGKRARTLRVGVPICYELLFPDLMRRFAGDGAQLLFGITNDAWYGRTGAPDQFLAMTAMRAAESRVPLVRAANTGISASIRATGRISGEHGEDERSEIFERSFVLDDVVPRARGTSLPFYARFGDLFAWACWGLALAALALAKSGEVEHRPARGS